MPLGMPSYTDYDQMLGMNPWAQMQAGEQLGLANQFQQQDLQKGNLANEKASLDNLFTAQDNPNRVQERVLKNTGLEQDNGMGALKLERAQKNQKNLLDEDQRKAVLSASEDEIKQLDHHVGLLLRDPSTHQEGLKLQELMPEILAERRKAATAMELERYKQMQETGRSIERNQTTLQAADIGAASRVAVAGTKSGGKGAPSATALLAKMKVPERVGQLKAMLDADENPERPGEPMSNAERIYYQSMYDQDVRTLDAKTAAQGQGIAPTVDGGRVVLQPKVAPTVGGGAPTAAPKPQEHSLSKVQDMYPGVPPAELKRLYKKKFGVDLQ